MGILKSFTGCVVLAASLTFTACNKKLEVLPTYQLTTANAFNSLDAYGQHLNAIYAGGTTTVANPSAGFASSNYYNSYLGATADIFSDNLYETTESFASLQVLANWDYQSNVDYMRQVWVQPYSVIFAANTIINGIDQYKSENEKKYNRILGQALTARAIAHFDLLKSFADSLGRNATTAGIPVRTTTDVALPKRNTVNEVYDAIYVDLNRALTLLRDVDEPINTITRRAYLDEWGARAAFARIALYARDYTAAIHFATHVIERYPLAGRAAYAGIWNDTNVEEVIWAIQNLPGDAGSPAPGGDIMSYRFDRNVFGVHPSVINLYDKVNDVRFATFYFVRNTQGGIANYALQKYKGKGAAIDNLVNFKVFRASEMYLIRAEANAHTNKAAESNADLAALKGARINGYVHTALSGAMLLEEIQNERRRELIGEGHRWFDLKRTTREVNRPATGIGNRNALSKTFLPANSNKWAWPIPEVEIRANNNITQNIGY